MNGAVWCGVVVEIWFLRTACLMDVTVDTKMWLIFIVVENVTERVKLMWTCGLEYTHVSFVGAVSCKHSSSSYKALQHSRKHYNLQTPLLQVIYKTRFVNHCYRGGRSVSNRSGSVWLAVTCGCVVHVGEREIERERQTVPLLSATPSKPSHRLLHITVRRKWIIILKTKEKRMAIVYKFG
jgi:hypothetical protein